MCKLTLPKQTAWWLSINGYLVLNDFPHSQHWPTLIHIDLHLAAINSSINRCDRTSEKMKYNKALYRSTVTIPLHHCRSNMYPFLQHLLQSCLYSDLQGYQPLCPIRRPWDNTTIWDCKCSLMSLSMKGWSLILRLGAAQKPPYSKLTPCHTQLIGKEPKRNIKYKKSNYYWAKDTLQTSPGERHP